MSGKMKHDFYVPVVQQQVVLANVPLRNGPIGYGLLFLPNKHSFVPGQI